LKNHKKLSKPSKKDFERGEKQELFKVLNKRFKTIDLGNLPNFCIVFKKFVF